MSSTKALLYDLCVILAVGFALADDTPISHEDGPKGNCTCAGFSTDTADVGVAPLIAQNPGLEVKCDSDGDTTCKSLCVALATAAKAKGPDALCNRLKDADELKLSAFYKICERSWTYANMTANEPLCCENNKSKTCPSVEKANANATNIGLADAKTVL